MRRIRARGAMPQTTEQLRHKYRLLAVHSKMMSQRYPNKHWARNFDPAHLRNMSIGCSATLLRNSRRLQQQGRRASLQPGLLFSGTNWSCGKKR